MKKIQSILLSLIILATASIGVSCSKKGLKAEEVPDYSGYNHQFDFYGYHAVHDGYYYIDDEKYYVGESFLTEEQYKLYRDVGMTIVYPQSILKIRGESGSMEGSGPTKELDEAKFYADREADFERVKVEIDKFVSIGMNKTVLYDEDLSWLGLNGYTGEGLVGEGKKYATEDELDEQVYKLVSLYADYPGVYGVCLADEPKHLAVEAYGEVYRSIKRINQKYGFNLYPDFNLNPLNLSKTVYEDYYPHVEGTQSGEEFDGSAKFEDGMIRYKQYINDFLDSMNPTCIQYDDYPLRHGYLSATYIPCLQFIAEVAKERGIEFHMVTQSFEMNVNGSRSMRRLTEPGAKWLNNMLLGFGVSELSYFTYYTRTENDTDGESFDDLGSFVSLYGKPTDIYYMMKDIIAQNKSFAPTILQFDYQKSGVFTKLPCNYNVDHVQYVEQNVQTYAKVKSVSVNKECAMVNELYDKENGRYMYMAMNIVDPEHQGSPVYQTITLEFTSEYKYALVYRDGESKLYKLEDGKLNVKGAPGDASFIIPF